MNTLDSTIIAYADTQYGEMLCAEHGGERDALIAANPENNEEDRLSPIMSWDGVDGPVVEWCGAGHSFCMSCGDDMDTVKGSQDADVNGHFARCGNCGTESVYVDGAGYDYSGSGRWSDATETHNVQVYGPEVTYVTMNRYTKVDTIIDEAGTTVRTLRAYLCFLDLAPSAGTVLVLANGDESHARHAADNAATDHFVDGADDLDQSDELAMSDFRASVQVVEIPTDQVWFTSK
jgi:hypothetical protein